MGRPGVPLEAMDLRHSTVDIHLKSAKQRAKCAELRNDCEF